jgi:ribosomal-protein-alanine N-acetyltransferase
VASGLSGGGVRLPWQAVLQRLGIRGGSSVFSTLEAVSNHSVRRPAAPTLFETDRLLLRRPRASDAVTMFTRYASDPEVTRFLGWPTHRSVADTAEFLTFCEAHWRQWRVGPYLIESRRTGALVGSTGLGFETPHQAATGYVLARDAWGHGYATEALLAMRALAFRLGVQRLYALCHPEHRASSHVLEKCGFSSEGLLPAHTEFPNLTPGITADVLCYAVAPAGV